jgi:SAM-dependent methyltransferase
MNQRKPEEAAPVYSVDSARRYEDERYSHLDQKLIDWAERRLITSFLDEAALGSNGAGARGIVLDAPSGYGRVSGAILERFARTVELDLSHAMVERTRDRVGSRGHYCVGDLSRLPFGDDTFEGVVVIRLIQHLDPAARRAVLAETARVTSSWAVVSAYANIPFHTAIRRLQGRPPKGASLDELTAEMRAAGFVIARSRAPLPALHAQRIFLLRKESARTRA